MSDYKIKLEDKAAFLNRLEKQGITVDSFDIKDNKLKGYFEFSIDDPQSNEIIKTILKQSPKINKINEMQKKITKGQLAQIIREELDAAGIKNTLNEDLMQTAIQAGLDPATLKFVAGILGSGALATIVGAIANREKKAGGKPTMGKMAGAAPIAADKEEPLNENVLTDPNFIAGLATLLGVGGTYAATLVKAMKGKSAEEKKKIAADMAAGVSKATGA
jgi:hypothetical protein